VRERAREAREDRRAVGLARRAAPRHARARRAWRRAPCSARRRG
jgi:hypothetical protein